MGILVALRGRLSPKGWMYPPPPPQDRGIHTQVSQQSQGGVLKAITGRKVTICSHLTYSSWSPGASPARLPPARDKEQRKASWGHSLTGQLDSLKPSALDASRMHNPNAREAGSPPMCFFFLCFPIKHPEMAGDGCLIGLMLGMMYQETVSKF